MVNLHRSIGVFAERVPLSGGTDYQGNKEDLDVYLDGVRFAPLRGQVKGLKGPRGCKGVIDALGDADVLFMRFDAEPGQRVKPPLVVMPWATWERLLLRQRQP